MKKQILIIALLLLSVTFFSCNSNKKSKEVASYTYTEDAAVNAIKNKKVGEWVKEGTLCYGIAVFVNNKNSKVEAGKPIKAKVIKISENEITMKSLENISRSGVKGCSAIGMKKGEIWIEKEGDLFKTKEEAIKFLKEKKWYLN